MKIFYCIILLFVVGMVNAQTDEEPVAKKVDKPVRSPFESSYLIDNQTTVVMPKKTLQMAIQHKFGNFENGKSDIWGVYGSANIRIGFDYVPIKNLQVGYGLTRTNLTHDFNLKWTILEQTRNNTIPVAVAVYGNVGLSGDPDEAFGANYSFMGRFSFYGQAMVGRKFGDRVTLQLGGSFSHINMVDTATMDYDRIGIHFNGRIKVAATGSIIFNYDQPLETLRLTGPTNKDINNSPNISFGYEISTSTHAFQIFCGYTKEILPQHVMLKNQGEFTFEQFRLGFIITRLWSL